MEEYKVFIRNNRAVLIGHILIYAQGIILMPVIIKAAGVTIYGGYILISTIVGLIYGISSFGVGFKSGRFLPAAKAKDRRNAIFYPQFCFQLLSLILLSLVFISFYSFLDSLFFKGELVFSKWLVFPWFISNFIYSQAASYFISTHRVHHFNYATVAFPYINILLVLIFCITNHNLSVNILFLTQVLTYLVIGVPLSIMLIREIGMKFTLPDLKSLIEDIKLGFPLRVNFIMDFLLGSSDRYVITYFLTVAAVGYYSPGYALGSLIIFFPRASGVVLMPLLSRAIDNAKQSEAENMLNYTIRGFLLLAIPFIIGSAVLSSSLLSLFANAEVSQKAHMVTPVVAVANLFFGLNIILFNALWVREKTAIILKMNAVAAIINLALNLIFLSIFKNILVAAFTTLISYLIVFVSIRKVVLKDWTVNFGLKIILKSIVASIFMGVILYSIFLNVGISSHRVWFLLGKIIVAAIVYVIALFVMKTFSQKEMQFIKRVFFITIESGC